MRLSRPLVQFFLFAILVLVFQPMKTGFEPGHHGWVSAHTLAQISNATPANHFLGFTQKTIVEGHTDYHYIDRYPFFFAGGMNLLLSPVWDNLGWTIYLGRQLMNLIFLFSAFFIWRICRLLHDDEKKATLVTAFVMSSSLFIKYKDMVHFDQPALLGCLILLNGILEYELNGKKRLLYIGAVLGPLMGRGYAVIFFIAGWLLVKFIRNLMDSRKFLDSIRKVPVLFLIISIPLPTLLLANNIAAEARMRKIGWTETSILVSAQHRLGLLKYKTSDLKEKEFSWGSYLSNQVQRTMDFFTPYGLYGLHVKNYKNKLLHYTSILPKAIFQLFLLYLLIKFFPPWWKAHDRKKRDIFLSLVAGGLLWILVMRNLANYHEYVTLYLVGFVIICWSFLVDRFVSQTEKRRKIAALSIVISLSLHSAWGWYEAGKVNWQAREFQKVRDQLKTEKVERVYLTPTVFDFFLDGVKWGDSFFLSGYVITHEPREAQKQILKVMTPEGTALEIKSL